MTKETNIKLFEEKKVRSIWNEENEEWYFSVVDVVAVLTDSINPTDYLKKMRKRDIGLSDYIGTNCPHVEMYTETLKKRRTLAGSSGSHDRLGIDFYHVGRTCHNRNLSKRAT